SRRRVASQATPLPPSHQGGQHDPAPADRPLYRSGHKNRTPDYEAPMRPVTPPRSARPVRRSATPAADALDEAQTSSLTTPCAPCLCPAHGKPAPADHQQCAANANDIGGENEIPFIQD